MICGAVQLEIKPEKRMRCEISGYPDTREVITVHFGSPTRECGYVDYFLEGARGSCGGGNLSEGGWEAPVARIATSTGVVQIGVGCLN